MLDDYWRSIAHADMADWTTFAAYLLTALLCFAAARLASLRRKTGEGVFWRSAAAAMLFLSVNELLDLQTVLTAIGRANAKATGWYSEHRVVQFYFVSALAAGAGVAGALILWLARHADGAVKLALAGFVFIGLFVLVRAASFHNVDVILGMEAPLFNLGSWQELFGIAVVALAAALYRRGGRARQARKTRGVRSG